MVGDLHVMHLFGVNLLAQKKLGVEFSVVQVFLVVKALVTAYPQIDLNFLSEISGSRRSLS